MAEFTFHEGLRFHKFKSEEDHKLLRNRVALFLLLSRPPFAQRPSLLEAPDSGSNGSQLKGRRAAFLLFPRVCYLHLFYETIKRPALIVRDSAIYFIWHQSAVEFKKKKKKKDFVVKLIGTKY